MDSHLRQSNLTRLRRETPCLFNLLPQGQKSKFSFSNIRSNKGSAMVMAMFFMLVATVLITTGMKLVSSASRDAKQNEVFVGEAENVARAGLTDALGYFRRQQTIVKAFNQNYVPGQVPSFKSGYSYADQAFQPIYNGSNPATSDTLDPNIGIVSEYPLDGGGTTTDAVLFGRYEVRRQQDPLYPNPTTTQTPWVNPTKTCTPDPYAVHDISGNRATGSVDGDGYVWQIQSTGYVYRRMDKTQSAPGVWATPYYLPPNKLIATARVTTELRKMSLNLPAITTPGPAVTCWGAVYAQSTTMVTCSSSDFSLLNGAVSVSGTYDVVGMNKGTTVIVITPTPTKTGTPTNTPTPSTIVQIDPAGPNSISVSGTKANFNLTVSPALASPLLIVQVFIQTSSAAVSTVSYNGSPLSLAIADKDASNTIDSEIWFLHNPPSGNHPVSVVITGGTSYTINVGAINYFNAAGIGATNSKNYTSATSSPTMNLNTTVTGSLITSMCSETSTRAITSNGSQNPEYSLTASDRVVGDDLGTNSSGSYTLSYTIAASRNEDIVAAEIIPVALTPTPSPTATSILTPTPTWTPNINCPLPINADSVNNQGNPLCYGNYMPGSVNTALLDSTVFGMSLNDLKFIADYTGDATHQLPVSFSSWKLTYFNGNLAYNASLGPPYQRLNASGILVVNGDLTLGAGNGGAILPSSYEGMVFVTGNLTVTDASEIDGVVIMGLSNSFLGSGGHVTLNGTAGNFGTIQLNPGLFNTAMALVAQYREDVTARKTMLAIPNL